MPRPGRPYLNQYQKKETMVKGSVGLVVLGEVVGERLRVRLTRGWMPKGKAKASVYRRAYSVGLGERQR